MVKAKERGQQGNSAVCYIQCEVDFFWSDKKVYIDIFTLQFFSIVKSLRLRFLGFVFGYFLVNKKY